MNIKHLLIFSSFFFTINLSAQDPYFAQFYTSPLNLNPAMIGVYEGQFRVAMNYREQWGSILGSNPFRTISASFDARQQVGRGDYIGFATSVLRDEAGTSNYTQNRANLGVSFMKQLSGGRGYRGGAAQYLVAGALAGVGQNDFDPAGLWFSEQYDAENEAINFEAANGEAFDMTSTGIFPNLSAGILWYALFDDNMSIYAGAGMYHLNTPNISFLDATTNLNARIMAHIGGELPFNDNLSSLPAAVVMKQGEAMNVIAGGNFRYTNRDWREVAVRIGGWAQFSNKLDNGVNNAHIIATAILEMERWNLGISYDLNANITPATNARGAYELSLIYTHPEKRRRGKIRCPKL